MGKIKHSTAAALLVLCFAMALPSSVSANSNLGASGTQTSISSEVLNSLGSFWAWLTGPVYSMPTADGGGEPGCPVRICGNTDPR